MNVYFLKVTMKSWTGHSKRLENFISCKKVFLFCITPSNSWSSKRANEMLYVLYHTQCLQATLNMVYYVLSVIFWLQSHETLIFSTVVSDVLREPGNFVFKALLLWNTKSWFFGPSKVCTALLKLLTSGRITWTISNTLKIFPYCIFCKVLVFIV